MLEQLIVSYLFITISFVNAAKELAIVPLATLVLHSVAPAKMESENSEMRFFFVYIFSSSLSPAPSLFFFGLFEKQREKRSKRDVSDRKFFKNFSV
jgi:hypothetical protein